MDLFLKIKKKPSRDVRLVILSDLAVFSSKQDGIWRDLGVKAYKHFQTLLLKFLSSESFHNKDGNLFVGFQYFDSRDPDFKIGRKAGKAEFKAFTDKTLQNWKGIHEKSLKQRRKRKKETSESKVKTFSSHAQALKRLCLEFSWVETDLFEEHAFEDDTRKRQYVVIFSDLPKFDAKFKRNLPKGEADILTRSLKTFEGAVDMVHKKKVHTFWWNINQNQVSPAEIRQINAILSKNSCGRVVPIEHLMYGTSTTPSHVKRNVINNAAHSPQTIVEPTTLWHGKLTIAGREWALGTEDVGMIQLVCNDASITLPEDVHIDPTSDANCVLTFTSIMPNERLPSYVWLDHSLLLITSKNESTGTKISNFEQVSIFLAEQGLSAIGYFEDINGKLHHCMAIGVTANVIELRFCPVRKQFESVALKSISTASFPRLKWSSSNVRVHLTALPMKRKAFFLKKPLMDSQDSQLNSEAVRTIFNGNDLDHALILAIPPISDENYQLMAQIVQTVEKTEESDSRDSRIREHGANYIQYRMEEGLGLCCGENESSRGDSFEDPDATIISGISFDPKSEEDIFDVLKQLYRASVETEEPNCYRFAEYIRKAVTSLGEYQADDPRKKMKKWLTKNLLISKKQMHKVFGKDDNHRLNECRLQVVIRLELVVSLIPEVVDPCKARVLNTMKNYISDMAFIHDAKKVEKEFLRGLLKKYKSSLPKTLNEFYFHLDLDIPSEIKVNPTPKRSPKKSQQESPTSQLKKCTKKQKQKLSPHRRESDIFAPRRSPRLMKKREREKSIVAVPTLRQPPRRRRVSSILPVTVMTNTVPLSKPKRSVTPVYAFTRDLEFKAPVLSRKPSFTKRRSIRQRLKRKASDYIDDSDDEEDGLESHKRAPLPTKKKPAFVKPLPKKKTVVSSNDSEKQSSVSKVSKKRKCSPPSDIDEATPFAPILTFKKPPPKKRKTSDDSDARSMLLNSASKKRKRSQKRTPTPPAPILSFQLPPREGPSSDDQPSPVKKKKITRESLTKKKKCTPVRKRPRRKKKRLKESPLFVPRQKRRKQLEKIRRLEDQSKACLTE